MNDKTTRRLTEEELDQLPTEEEFLRHYDPRVYPPQAVATDLAIFTIRDEKLCILLIRRAGHPEKGKWSLPGGFARVDETLDQAAARRLSEETGLKLDHSYLEQLRTYSEPDRDPRGYVVSAAYVALVPQATTPVAGPSVLKGSAGFVPVEEVLSGYDLAFNHREILEDGLERVRAKLEYSPIAAHFLEGESFTIPEFMRIYEIVWGVKFRHPSNFRRKVKSAADLLLPVGTKGVPSFRGGRSSDLYRLGPAVTIFPPLRRQDAEE